jgi:hypothetical protein
MLAIIPSENLNEYLEYTIRKVIEEYGTSFRREWNQNYGSFAGISWSGSTVTLDKMLEWTREFFPFYTTEKLNENQFISYEQTKCFYRGANSLAGSLEETTWRDKIVSLIGEMEEFSSPISIELNSSNGELPRLVPTVIVTPCQTWRAQGHPPTSDTTGIILYKESAIVTYIPNSFNGLGLYYSMDHPNDVLNLNFCTVIKNMYGIGNTVVLNSSTFSSEESNNSSIYKLLAQKDIWEKVLLHLATTSFEEVKSNIENQIIPIKVQIYLFKQQAQESIRQDLARLNRSRQENLEYINSYIRSITDYKLALISIDEQISTRQKELNEKMSFSKIEKEIESLKNLPYVSKLEFSGNEVRFYLEPIQVDDGPILGPYKVIYTSGDKSLRIYNEGNPINEDGRLLAHPHIPQGEQPCFGNYTDIFLRFETMDYYVGLELLHEFLSSYNPEDIWGRRLIYWDAEYTLNDLKTRDLLHKVESCYDEQYSQIFGEHLRQGDTCSRCGEYIEDCECDRCSFCNRLTDDCECCFCEHCGEHEDDCTCERCSRCGEIIENCLCDRCSQCHELENFSYSPHCECDRCPDNEDMLVSEDNCDGCDNIDCEFFNE